MPVSSQKFSRFPCWYYWWYDIKTLCGEATSDSKFVVLCKSTNYSKLVQQSRGHTDILSLLSEGADINLKVTILIFSHVYKHIIGIIFHLLMFIRYSDSRMFGSVTSCACLSITCFKYRHRYIVKEITRYFWKSLWIACHERYSWQCLTLWYICYRRCKRGSKVKLWVRYKSTVIVSKCLKACLLLRWISYRCKRMFWFKKQLTPLLCWGRTEKYNFTLICWGTDWGVPVSRNIFFRWILRPQVTTVLSPLSVGDCSVHRLRESSRHSL